MNIAELISNQREGFALEQEFYQSAEVYKLDIEKIVLKHWLPLDHESRIPNIGDYFLASLLGESIIVIRGKQGEIHAHYNVCRHRGSRVCSAAEGNLRRLTCPYHAWTYDLDGSLIAARLMQENFDRSDYGLKSCHLKVYQGLIYVNLGSAQPESFEDQIEPLKPFIELHGLTDAKIAYRKTYPADANWKLVIENFFECYHCAPSHPEYSSVHSAAKQLAFGAGPKSGSADDVAAFEPEMKAWQEGAEALGHFTGAYSSPDETRFTSAMRTPIKPGSLSETQDGTPASTLMGKFKDFDGGQTAVTLNPFGTLLMCNDFAVLLRFIPVSPTYSEMEVIWLVASDAAEGKDYNLDKLIWVWDVTTEQDKSIIEGNNAGVMSRHYVPGPYSTQEAATARFTRWYLGLLAD